MFNIFALVFLIAAWLFFTRILKVGRRGNDLPPGPPTLPVLGNILDISFDYLQYRLTDWARQYGPIYSLKIGNETMVILTSAAAVRELLDVRSGISPDRPPNYVADQVTGGKNLAMMRYNETWKRFRRIIHLVLTPQSVAERLLPIQRAEATQLMFDFSREPDNFLRHIERYTNSIVMSVMFGTRSPHYDTKYSRDFFHMEEIWLDLLIPGKQPPLDLLPILKYVPRRFASWKRIVDEVRKMQHDLYFGLRDKCKERMAKGIENGCYMESVIRDRKALGLSKEEVGYIGGIMIEAGSDTTSTFLRWLVLLLTLYPEVQRKAQEEIDRVVGKQLPSPSDFERLPYLQALIKEIHRFRPIAPLSVPHYTMEDQWYDGYLIPKNTTIFANQWGIFHDPELFEEPEVLNPERYLLSEHGTKSGADDRAFRSSMPFGNGRRSCPGVHLANNSIVINAMNFVWGFNFEPPLGPDGVEIWPDPWNYDPTISSNPRPFKSRITPRSAEKTNMIKMEFLNAIHTFEQFEHDLEEEDKVYLVDRAMIAL